MLIGMTEIKSRASLGVGVAMVLLVAPLVALAERLANAYLPDWQEVTSTP